MLCRVSCCEIPTLTMFLQRGSGICTWRRCEPRGRSRHHCRTRNWQVPRAEKARCIAPRCFHPTAAVRQFFTLVDRSLLFLTESLVPISNSAFRLGDHCPELVRGYRYPSGGLSFETHPAGSTFKVEVPHVHVRWLLETSAQVMCHMVFPVHLPCDLCGLQQQQYYRIRSTNRHDLDGGGEWHCRLYRRWWSGDERRVSQSARSSRGFVGQRVYRRYDQQPSA